MGGARPNVETKAVKGGGSDAESGRGGSETRRSRSGCVRLLL